MADTMRLARLIAGLGPNPFMVPFTGLRNEPDKQVALPPPQMPMGQNMPSHGLPAFDAAGMAPPPAAPQPQPMPQPAPQPAPAPMAGGQGWGGPEPMGMAPQPAPYDANLDPRYLPEQWRGAFNWQGG